MRLWYHVVKAYVSLGLKLFFKKIKVEGTGHIPRQGPVLFAVNHQNAFLDALLVGTTNQRYSHFLVRADVFRYPLVSWLFRSLNMMPVYRIRDGRHRLSKNQEIFEQCHEILRKEQALLVFPEANHHQLRRLLPLSKGFARIVLGLDSAVQIVPVGINYTHHRLFGASVKIKYGPPLATNGTIQEDHSSAVHLRNQVSAAMKKLITHIPQGPHYQRFEDHLNQDPSRYLNPQQCNHWVHSADPEVLPVKTHDTAPSVVRKWIKNFSFLMHLPPFLLCRQVLKKLGDPVFQGSIKFVTGILIFPWYYLLITTVSYGLFGFPVAMTLAGVCVLSMMGRKWSLSIE